MGCLGVRFCASSVELGVSDYKGILEGTTEPGAGVPTGWATTSANAIDLKMKFGTTKTANTCQCIIAYAELS
jgi:hypothetical protein